MTANTSDTRGKVITFYSYKGGTGRSMALANVACLLAQRSAPSRGVLMMDWDLEAPGLHRFFRERFSKRFGSGEQSEAKLNTAPGLIDLFFDLAAATAPVAPNTQSEDDAYALMEQFDLEKYIIQTDIPSLSLLKAGNFDDMYSQRVTTFNWEALYRRSPFLMQALAERLARDYGYVLVDSRTGISDVSGVCTMLLPEKLVVVFTPNRQSLLGLQDLIRRATKYRRQSDDLRPLIVLPLPSRIDLSEKDLQQWWRSSSDKVEVVAYQPLFEQLFKEVYELRTCDLSTYFDEVRIQHFPFYSYGEKIAVLQAGESDRLSLARSYETFVTWLVDRRFPWKDETPALQQAEVAASPDDVKAAENALARLNPDDQRTLRRVLLRLVRLPETDYTSLLYTSLQAKLADFDQPAQQVIRAMHEARLLVVEKNDKGEETVRFANDALVNSWPRLTTWVKEDYDLLLQRQQLRANISQWEKANKDESTLLSDALLNDAKALLTNRRANLNADEEKFIRESELAVEKKRTRNRITLLIAATTGILVLAILLWQYLSSQKQEEFKTLISEGYRLRTDSPDSAIAVFTKAIEFQSDNADAYFGRGLILTDKGKYVEVMADYDSVIARQPENASAHNNRGNALLQVGETKRAVADFDRALQLDSALAMANNNRAYIYFLDGENDAALRFYSRAIELDSSITLSYRGRGNTRLRMGDSVGAIDDYTTGIKRRPEAESYFARGLIFYSSGAYESARSDNTNALELRPDYAEAYYNRALSFYNLNNRQAAINDMRKVVALATDSTLLRDANNQLQKWGAETARESSRANVSPRIFIYYNDMNDSAVVRRLRERIAEEEVTLGKVQLRSERTFGEVRYYFESDRKIAERIRSIVQREFAGALRIKIELQMNFVGVFFEQNVRQSSANRISTPGTIEVWLPSLQNYSRSR